MAANEQVNPAADMLKEIAAIKKADREELMAMPPDEAQAAVEQILHPRLWRIQDPRQLAWPGDLADDAMLVRFQMTLRGSANHARSAGVSRSKFKIAGRNAIPFAKLDSQQF